MKKILIFLTAFIITFFWIEMVNLSFDLMNVSDTYVFYLGLLILGLITMGPIFYFKDNIVMFLKNMKSVFSNEEKKD
jgi:hypothetical protein